jgi:hypothetical protein
MEMEASSAWPFAGAWMRTGRCRSGDVRKHGVGVVKREERLRQAWQAGFAGMTRGSMEGSM